MSNIAAILLAGGKGTRLSSVSQGISKGLIPIDASRTISGVEHARRIFSAVGIRDVTLVVCVGAEQYNEFIRSTSYGVVRHTPDIESGGALEETLRQVGADKQYLVMSADTYASARDVAKLLASHKAGTITWAVSPRDPDLMMDSYGGLVVDSAGRILGDATQSDWPKRELEKHNVFIKGALQIIDPGLYLRAVQNFKATRGNPTRFDLYWDIMPMLEEQNRRHVSDGGVSFMNAVIFEDHLIDYGTPERLAITRARYTSRSTEL